MDDFDECLVCGGDVVEIGMLGSTRYRVCRCCGMTGSLAVASERNDEARIG